MGGKKLFVTIKNFPEAMDFNKSAFESSKLLLFEFIIKIIRSIIWQIKKAKCYLLHICTFYVST